MKEVSQSEAEMVVRSFEQVDVATVKAHAQDLRSLLEEAYYTKRKASLRLFIKRIEVNKKQVTVLYNLPMPREAPREQVGVLPIDTPGGAGVTIGRTFELAFSLTI